MAISQSQKVDFLYKKLGFTKTKTGLSVDGTLSGTKKAGFAEVFASPLVIADGSVWNQSELIPTTPPGSTTSIVRVYGVASALRMTVDATTAGRRSYIAYETFNDTTSARLTNWIDTQFGNDYVVKVYAGDPNSGGTPLPAGGTTGSDSWFFDYSAGILQFHDTTIHSNIDANGTNVYIVGYRYLGQTGVISIGDDTNFGDLTVNNNFKVGGISTFVGPVILNNNIDVGGISTFAGLTTVTGHTLFTKQLDVSGISTFSGALDVNSNIDVDGHTELDDLQVSGVSTFIGAMNVANGSGVIEDAGGQLKIKAGTFNFRNNLDNKNIIFATGTGGVILYNQGQQKLETLGFGATVYGTTETQKLNVTGISTFEGAIDANSTSNFGDDVTFQTANTKNLVLDKSDNSLKFGDSVKAKFGDDINLEIYHGADGGVDYNEIQSSVGNIRIRNNDTGASTKHLYLQSEIVQLRTHTNNHLMISAYAGSRIELYHNNEIRFETTGIGVSVLAGTGNTATIAGPQFLVLDPDGVGVNTGVVRIKGDLIVDGEQTIIKSTELEIADFIVGIASTATTDALADGAGFKIGPDNTLLYEHNGGANPSLKSSENLNVATGKVYQIAETERLSANTLSLGTGTTIHAVGTNILTIGTGDAERVRISDDGISITGIATIGSGVGVTTILDEDNMASNSATALVTQQSVKAYIDDNITAQDLDFVGDSGSGSVDLDSQSLDIEGTANEIETSASGQKITIGLPNNVTIGNQLTVTGNIDANADLDVDGHTELDDLNVTGVSTFKGIIDADHQIVGLATNNVIPFLYSNYSDLPSASTYHGAFAHVHATGKGYFGHANAWYELVNRNLDGTVGTGTDSYNVGVITATTGDFVDIDVDGHTELDNLNVSGISTFVGAIDANGNLDVDGYTELDDLNVSGVTTTVQLKVGTSGQTLVGITTILDEDNMASNSAAALATQQSIKAYVDTQVTAQDLDFVGDSGTGSVDLDSQSLDIEGTANEIETVAANQKITIGLPDYVTASNLNVSGVSTFTGISTFGSAVHVDGLTNLDDVIISGVTTTSNHILPDTNGTSVDLGASNKHFRNLYVSNLVTAPGGPGIIGPDLTIRNINATGIVTVTGSTDLNGNLDVDGYTELDDLNVSGVTTTVQFKIGTAGQTLVGITTILDEDNMASNSAAALATQQSIKAYVDSSNPTGSNLAVSADSGSNENINLASEVLDIEGTSNEIETSTGTNKVVIGLPDDVTIGRDLTVTRNLSATGNLTVGAGGTVITTVVGAAASIGIGDASPSYMLDVAGAINSQTDIKVNGVSVTEQALNDAVAMAIALG